MPSSTNQTKQQRGRARSGQKSGKLAPQRNNTINAPSAQNRSSFQKRGKNSNSTRYRECERIGTVNGSVAFANVLNIPANPALPGSFPWLAGHASLYEKYKIHSLLYRYKNLKGTSTDGNIIMSFDYDTLDAPPIDAITQSQSTVWIDGAPWRIFEMKVPVDSVARFTRTGDVVGSDLKTYDFGRVHLSAEGCADTSAHGYLEVEYDIECFDKQKSSIVSAFQMPRVDFPLAFFDAVSNFYEYGQVIKLDEIESQSAIQYDPLTGVFTPESGWYRIDPLSFKDRVTLYSDELASWVGGVKGRGTIVLSPGTLPKKQQNIYGSTVYRFDEGVTFHFEWDGPARNVAINLCIQRLQ